MTKSWEQGDNEITNKAKREAARTGKAVDSILAELLANAKATGDKSRVRKILRAQKYLGFRNIRKRRSNL